MRLILKKLALPIMMAVLSLSTVSAPASVGAFAAASSSTGEKTDITTSNVFMDLRLLTGSKSDFNPLTNESTYPGSSSMYDNFLFIAGRPYQKDLYLYFCFINNVGKTNWYSSNEYACEIAVGSTISENPTFKVYKLEQVKNSSDYGNVHYVKYVIHDIFSSTLNEKNTYAINSFGTYTGGVSFISQFMIQATQEFTYDDDHYDITSTLRKQQAIVVKNQYAVQWQILDAVTTPMALQGYQDGHFGATENDFGFFNTDISIDQIMGIEIHYDYINYTVSAPYSQISTFSGINSSGHTDYYAVPATQYDEDNSKIKLISHDVKKQWISASDTVSVTTTSGVGKIMSFWLTDVKHSFNKLIDMNNIPTTIDPLEKEFLAAHNDAKNPYNGEQITRRFAYLAETGRREWTGSVYQGVINYTNFLLNPMACDCNCHECQGQIVSRVMFMKDNKVYDMNAWSDSVNNDPNPVRTTAPSVSLIEWIKQKSQEALKSWWETYGKIIGIIMASVAGAALLIWGSVHFADEAIENGSGKGKGRRK